MIKFVTFLFVSLFLLTQSVQQAGAHAEGLLPFLTINGEYPDINPIQKESIVPQAFSVPEDIAKKNYLVHEEIVFSIDTSVMLRVYSQEVLDTVIYEWELGDGTSASGTEVKHTYKQIGSKVLTIYAKFNDPEVTLPPQPIETVQMDIVPDKNYSIPEPGIYTNRRALQQDSYEVNMQNPVSFEAKMKNNPTAEIASYTWDFGDGGKGIGERAVYTYSTDPAIVAPVLKVTDKNGFSAYTFGILTNGKNTQGYTFATNTVGTIILAVQAGVLLIGGIWFFIVVRKKKREK